jgi:tetratricopeptide (TPR) repeat protein
MRSRKMLVAAMLAAAALPARAGLNSDLPAPIPTEAPFCATPTGGSAPAQSAAGPPVLVEGLGFAGMTPDTSDPAARRWFDQGVRLTWAFDEVEAIRAFEEAQKIDPNCALCAWGEAWARGPTINLQPRNDQHSKAKAAAARALALSSRLSPRDRGLIEAMQVRIGGGGKFRSKPYHSAMARLAGLYPNDDAILVIAADARMLIFPREGKPPQGTDAQTWLETVLRRNPDHSGAIHMYIHLTDWIDRQDLAEQYADRLGRVAPAASHLVHMPSHTYYGIGRYGDAASVNLAAIAADRAYAAKVRPPESDYRTGLYGHDVHFAIQSALMRGDGRTALDMAEHFRTLYPLGKDAGFGRISRASTMYALGLHAPIGDVLALPEPPSVAAMEQAMRHYARGEALARKGDGAGVRAEAAALAALRAGPAGRAFGGAYGEALVEVAQRVLEGRAAMIAGDPRAAAASYWAGMKRQDGAHFYSDPPPFWYPVRRSVAAALLAQGDALGAEHQLTASLEGWPNDPLALYLLAKAQHALGREAEAARSLKRAKAGWVGDIEAMPLSRI